eukprot:5267377-Karenia_brevis.AAC.1
MLLEQLECVNDRRPLVSSYITCMLVQTHIPHVYLDDMMRATHSTARSMSSCKIFLTLSALLVE